MPPLSEWDAVVREIQHKTGLPDDSFRETPDGLVISGGGYKGDVTGPEMKGIVEVAEGRGFAVYARDGRAHVKDTRVDREPRDSDFVF